MASARAPGAAADDRQPLHSAHRLTPAPGRAGAAASSGQRGRTGGIEPVGQAEAQPFEPGPGDHRAVVGAQRRRRRDKVEARRLRPAPRAAARSR